MEGWNLYKVTENKVRFPEVMCESIMLIYEYRLFES
jgi:hypothetical protein